MLTPSELAHAILKSFGDAFIPKFERGQLEHGGDLLIKPGAIKQAKNENMDNTSYLFVIEYQVLAAWEARQTNSPKFQQCWARLGTFVYLY